jgi:hypothetical protein
MKALLIAILSVCSVAQAELIQIKSTITLEGSMKIDPMDVTEVHGRFQFSSVRELSTTPEVFASQPSFRSLDISAGTLMDNDPEADFLSLPYYPDKLTKDQLPSLTIERDALGFITKVSISAADFGMHLGEPAGEQESEYLRRWIKLMGANFIKATIKSSALVCESSGSESLFCTAEITVSAVADR